MRHRNIVYFPVYPATIPHKRFFPTKLSSSISPSHRFPTAKQKLVSVYMQQKQRLECARRVERSKISLLVSHYFHFHSDIWRREMKRHKSRGAIQVELRGVKKRKRWKSEKSCATLAASHEAKPSFIYRCLLSISPSFAIERRRSRSHDAKSSVCDETVCFYPSALETENERKWRE